MLSEAGIKDDVVVDEDAPVVDQQVVESRLRSRREEEDEAARAGAQVLAQQLLLERRVGVDGGRAHEERRVGRHLPRRGEVERLHVVVSQAQLVPRHRQAASGVDIVGAQLPVPDEEIDLLAVGIGDVEDGGRDGLLPDELLPRPVLDVVEVVRREHPPAAAAEEKHDPRSLDAVLLGLAPVLVQVDILDRDLARRGLTRSRTRIPGEAPRARGHGCLPPGCSR